MDEFRNLALIDSDYRRRAAITHALSGRKIHVEPFENAREILLRWPRAGTILIEDTGDSITRLIAEMSEIGKWLPLVAFAENPGIDRVVKAILEGAIDYVGWPSTVDHLVSVIETAETSGASLGSLKLREARARSKLQRLTRREREVLTGVAHGLSNRLIGERLEISPRTVEIHRANLLNKIGANHTSEAIRIAIEAALVA